MRKADHPRCPLLRLFCCCVFSRQWFARAARERAARTARRESVITRGERDKIFTSVLKCKTWLLCLLITATRIVRSGIGLDSISRESATDSVFAYLLAARSWSKCSPNAAKVLSSSYINKEHTYAHTRLNW